jgi:hypothetical protein
MPPTRRSSLRPCLASSLISTLAWSSKGNLPTPSTSRRTKLTSLARWRKSDRTKPSPPLFFCLVIARREFRLADWGPEGQITPYLLPNAKFGLQNQPGFPTLQNLRHTSQLAYAGLSVFGTSSRYCVCVCVCSFSMCHNGSSGPILAETNGASSGGHYVQEAESVAEAATA